MLNLIEDKSNSMKYLVFFSLEIVNRIISSKKVKASNIVFVADRQFQAQLAIKMFGVKTIIFGKNDLAINIIEAKKKRNKLGQGTNKETNLIFSHSFLNELNQTIPDLNKDNLTIIALPPNHFDKNNNKSPYVFSQFLEACINFAPKYICMMIISRWMQKNHGLNDLVNKVIKNGKMKIINTLDEKIDVLDMFKSNDITRGGMCYFLWDKDHNPDAGCMLNGNPRNFQKEFSDIIILDKKAFSVLGKIKLKKQKGAYSASFNVQSQGYFGIETNFSNWKEQGVKCYKRTPYVKGQPKRVPGQMRDINFSYCDAGLIKDKNNILNLWKVCTAKMTSTSPSDPGLNRDMVINGFFVVEPGAITTKTYTVIGAWKTEQEANNFISYAKTKIFRFLLGLGLPTNDVSPRSFAFVVAMDYSKSWDDAKLCEFFGLTAEEFNYIDSKIQDYK
jgi:site-specific DNA-methyltransferase (adenine-specific)